MTYSTKNTPSQIIINAALLFHSSPAPFRYFSSAYLTPHTKFVGFFFFVSFFEMSNLYGPSLQHTSQAYYLLTLCFATHTHTHTKHSTENGFIWKAHPSNYILKSLRNIHRVFHGARFIFWICARRKLNDTRRCAHRVRVSH